MSYSYYPSSSGSVEHVVKPGADDGRGSFGPVLLVLAVVSFLSVAACVAGRVCGRGPSSSTAGKCTSSDQHGAEAEKSDFGATQLAIMRPVPSSRATVHDVEDAFEIKLLPPNPAAREAGSTTMQGPPRQFMAAAAGAAGFRGPPSGNGGVVRQAHPPMRGGLAFVPAQRCK